MTIYFTSDCHFNHRKILEFCPNTRPFDCIEDHNWEIIENWNNVVRDEDDVYVLGDFVMGGAEGIDSILPELKGHIHLIRGNHDTPQKIKIYEEYGIDVHDIYYLSFGEVFFILCHFPIDNEGMRKMMFGPKHMNNVCLLYGHVHDNAPIGMKDKTFHVGVDTNNLTPVSIIDIMREWENYYSGQE